MELKDMKVSTDGLIEIENTDDEIINFWADSNDNEVDIGSSGDFDNLDELDWSDGSSVQDTLEVDEKEGVVSKDIGIDNKGNELSQDMGNGSEMGPDCAGDRLGVIDKGLGDDGDQIEPDGSESEIEGGVDLPSEIGIGDSNDRLDGEEEVSVANSVEQGDTVNTDELKAKTDIIVDNDFMDDEGKLLLQSKDGDLHARFKLEYIDITKIAVVKRIRLSKGVEDLLESIKSTGLLNPIVVAPTATNGIYVLINGYRRLIACAKLGIKEIPSIVNNKIETKDIPILETMYNRYKPYTMQEIVKCVDYLKNEKGIQSTSMIEYLLQLDSGDCSKLQDIIEDGDADIVDPLLNDEISIVQAFKKLEQRRKKESKEEKEIKQANKAYTDNDEQALADIKDVGEEANEDGALTDEEIESLAISNEEIAESENESLDGMVEQGKEIQGFEDNKQDYNHREHLDPALRKSVLARDENTCMCCGLQGQEYIGVFDVHHKVEVYLGGSDSIDNLITVCTVCHRLIHSYGRGDLYIRPEDQLSDEEKVKFKKIVKLGNKIREGMALKGMKKERLKELDNLDKIGRTKPGTPIQQAT